MASQKSADLEEKNAELLMELKNIDRMSKRLEESKSVDVGLVKAELAEARVYIVITYYVRSRWHTLVVRMLATHQNYGHLVNHLVMDPSNIVPPGKMT